MGEARPELGRGDRDHLAGDLGEAHGAAEDMDEAALVDPRAVAGRGPASFRRQACARGAGAVEHLFIAQRQHWSRLGRLDGMESGRQYGNDQREEPSGDEGLRAEFDPVREAVEPMVQ